MTKRNDRATAVAAILAGFLFVIPLAQAATNLKPEDCRFDARFAEIQKIRDDSRLTRSDQVAKELQVRKDILRRSLECAAADAQALKDKVEGVTSDSQDIQALRASFSNQLDSTLSFYARESSHIDTLGIEGSKELAREIKDWRTNNYTPASEQAIQFLVWVKNQEIFSAAGKRLANVQDTISSLKLGDSADIAALLSSAQDDYKQATELNMKAKNALEQFPPRENALDHIKSSLDQLSKTYEEFFKLSDAVQKLLPGTKNLQ